MRRRSGPSGAFLHPARAWAAAALLCAGTAGAQQSWTVEQYTSENGLLQNRVHAIDHDPWGGVLIGTEGGLVRFDGESFRQIGIQAPEGILPSRVLEIIPVPEDSYVIRDAGSRLYLYRNNQLTPITADAPTRKPTSRFSGTGVSVDVVVQALDPDSTLEGKNEWPYGVRMITLDNGQWCIRTNDHLLLYQDRSVVARIPTPQGKWSHLFALKGGLYIFDFQGKAYRINLEKGVTEPISTVGFPPPILHDGQVNWRINWDPNDHRVTMIALDGIYSIDTSADGQALAATHIPLELPTDCRVGGIVWLNNGQTLAVGTDTKGLFVFRKNTMRSLVCDMMGDGVNNAYFAQAPFGENGVVTSTRGITRMFTPEGCREGKPPVPVFDEAAIIWDREGHYWYGRNDTLFVYDPKVQVERMIEAGIRPLCFLEEGNSMLMGSPKGIFRVEHGTATLVNPLNEQDLSLRPTALCTTPDGELWVATCSGVYKALDNGGWQPLAGLEGVCARALAVIDKGIHIGTYGSGAFLFKNGKLLHLPMDQEGFLSHVHAFMPDREGFLWMSTNQGLFRVQRADLDRWVEDPSSNVYIAYYGKRAGIANSEFNGGCNPPFVRTRQGWASFPTMDGLVWFQPDNVPDAYPLAPILLEDLRVDGNELAPGGAITLPWGHHEVLVAFSMAYWGTRENAKLEYSIGGQAGTKWIPIRPDQRELRFPTFASGESILRIRKVGALFRNEGNALELRFVVPIPFYRTSWFVGLCTLAGILLFWSALRLNAARLRRRNLQLERMVRARTGELMSSNTELRRSLEMKEMLVSIISHDIVTPLRFIARVSSGAANGLQQQDPERLEDTLQDIARSSDKLHANAEGLLQWIKRQDGRIELRIRSVAAHPLVEDVLDMEQERALDKGLVMVNEVPLEDVIHTDRNVLAIILHNLVANAVTHTANGKVYVRGKALGKTYRIEVADTGNGMPEAALKHALRVQGRGALGAMNEEGERDVQGLGLLIVADLLQILGGSFTVDSVKGQGTTVSVSVPNIHSAGRGAKAVPGTTEATPSMA